MPPRRPTPVRSTASGPPPAGLLQDESPPDPLPVLRDQVREMFERLLLAGNAESSGRLSPLLALIVEADGRQQSCSSAPFTGPRYPAV